MLLIHNSEFQSIDSISHSLLAVGGNNHKTLYIHVDIHTYAYSCLFFVFLFSLDVRDLICAITSPKLAFIPYFLFHIFSLQYYYPRSSNTSYYFSTLVDYFKTSDYFKNSYCFRRFILFPPVVHLFRKI